MLATLRNRTSFMAASPSDLMPVQEWKTKSDVAWTVRGRLTSAIDKALKEYHEKNWGRDFESKLKALVTIVKNVHDHLREDTKRDAAYFLLANQIKAVVAALSRTGDAVWNERCFYGSRGRLI